MGKKVVVITGAGSGLGASLAKKFSELGSHVCLLGRSQEKLEKVAKQLSNKYSLYTVDVSKKQEVKKVFQSIKTDLGSIDILINNAGVGVFDLAENIDENAVHQMIDINLKGTIFCSQEVLHDMKKCDEGSIVNIISTAGMEGKVTESVYCASKFGVRGFSESLYRELENTQVKVCSVYMGGMKTEFWDGIFERDEIKDYMEPDDVADIILSSITPRKNLIVKDLVIKNKI